MKIEIVAPAGNLEKLKIALDYGADAVYIAGQRFGLRSGAENFTLPEIKLATKFARQKNKKLYLAVNAFSHDGEMEPLKEFLNSLREFPPHALICSDFGVIKTAQETLDVPIHLSTQASLMNGWHAKWAASQGIKRIVTARELSIDEVAQIGTQSGLEMEMFVQGALCMAFSGHCVISNYLAGRDSNRGGCIQNCRYQYQITPDESKEEGSYFMSSKDLRGIGRFKEFVNAGITALKIEGRMKSNLYIATTVRAYSQVKKNMLSNKNLDLDFWAKELEKIPHRDYTEGSLIEPAGPDSVYHHSDEIKSEFELAGTILKVDNQKERFLFQAKNKLLKGDRIEILDFSENIFNVEIKNCLDVTENPLELGQPHRTVWLPLVKGIKPNMAARIKRG